MTMPLDTIVAPDVRHHPGYRAVSAVRVRHKLGPYPPTPAKYIVYETAHPDNVLGAGNTRVQHQWTLIRIPADMPFTVQALVRPIEVDFP